MSTGISTAADSSTRSPGGAIVRVFTHLQQHSVSTEKLELLHRLRVQRNHRVVIIHGLVHNQPVRALLAVQDGCAEILLILCLAVMVQKVR